MKRVQLIHNPGAGEEKYDREELQRLLEDNGYDCQYLSTKKKGWKDFDTYVDVLLIAGGDGTIRKVAKEILETRLLDMPSYIAVLPLGTANNISKALQVPSQTQEVIRNMRSGKVNAFDVGRVFNIADGNFFLEGFGYGLFPHLMKEMKKYDDDDFKSPEEKMDKALEKLQELIKSYSPRYCRLEVDEKEYEGHYLLAEVMNISSIGPNLQLSTASNPGDGIFEVVLIPEGDRQNLLNYVDKKRAGVEEPFPFKIIQGRDINIRWEGKHAHLDDELMELEKNTEVSIHLKRGLLNFLGTEEAHT